MGRRDRIERRVPASSDDRAVAALKDSFSQRPAEAARRSRDEPDAHDQTFLAPAALARGL
jgi:hypothetical protein